MQQTLNSFKILLSTCIIVAFSMNGFCDSLFLKSESDFHLSAGRIKNDAILNDNCQDEELDLLDEDFDSFYEKNGPNDYPVADPIIYWNRAMYHFNDKLYFWGLKPLTKAYIAIAPQMVRSGVKNFFSNIATPIRLVSCILQLKIKNAGTEAARFIINSTIGIIGFGDPAKRYYGLKAKDEDIGQTFGFYGIGNGIYIVWPFLGPSTLRDSIGLVGDKFLNPVSYIEPWEVSAGITSYEIVNKTSFKIGDYEEFKAAAINPYEALKDAYIQNRRKKVSE